MILYNKEIINKLNAWSDDSIYVLADFDRTLTSYDSKTSWSILYNNDKINPEYKKQANKLYDYYRPYELDESIDFLKKSSLMESWWNDLITLSIKYQIPSTLIEELSNDKNTMKFREGTPKLLKNFYKRKIPVIIISAGLGNFIENFLKLNNCYYENIYIISNYLDFTNNIATGIKGPLIHTLNKNEISIPLNIKKLLQNRTNTILLGDQIADISMLSSTHQENALKIGFLEDNVSQLKQDYLNHFDIVCQEKTSFLDIMNEFPTLFKINK